MAFSRISYFESIFAALYITPLVITILRYYGGFDYAFRVFTYFRPSIRIARCYNNHFENFRPPKWKKFTEI